jgi:transcription termination factor NusB
MKRIDIKIWFLSLLVAMLALPVLAQAQTDPTQTTVTETTAATTQAQTEGVEHQRKPDPAKIAALKERIEQVKYEKIKENLELSDDQATKFFALYKPAEQDIEALVQKRNEAFLKVHEISDGGNQSADLEATLQNIRELTQQIQTRQQTLDENLKPLLTPQQRAHLLVFEQAFNRRVNEAITKHRIQRKLSQVRKRLQQLRKQHQKPKN